MPCYKGNPFWKESEVPKDQRQRAFTRRGKRRKAIRPEMGRWFWLRRKVFDRDAFTCQYCKAVKTERLLQVDHIVPVSHGGSSKLRNLVTACQSCNSRKGAKTLSRKKRRVIDKGLMERYAEREHRRKILEQENIEMAKMFNDKMAADD